MHLFLQVVYFTALFPYLAITGLLIVAAQLDGAKDGVLYYLKPPANASVLFDHKVQGLVNSPFQCIEFFFIFKCTSNTNIYGRCSGQYVT